MQRIWQATDAGYLFDLRVEAEQVNKEIVGSFLQMLAASDRVQQMEENCLLTHEEAVNLKADEQELLGLPQEFPYQLFVSNDRGDLGHSNLHYRVLLLQPDGTYFINPEIKGSYVRIGQSREYILRKEQYLLLKTTAACNETVSTLKTPQQVQKYNLENLEAIKRYGRKTDAKFSSYLETTKVVCPDKLSVDLVQQEGSGFYHAEPVLLQNTADGGYKVLDSKAFQGAFDSAADARSVYLGRDHVKYVCKDEIKDGLAKIKASKSFNKKEYADFKANPWNYFEEDVFEFPEGLYSDRVYGLIDHSYRYFGVEGINEGGWLPEEGTEYASAAIEFVNKENVEEIDRKLTEAQAKGENTVEINGEIVAITDELLEKVARLKEQQQSSFAGETKATAKDGATASANKVLGIKTNESNVDYAASYQKRAAYTALENVLNPQIELFQHQREGINWIYKQWCAGHKGVLLADDMGLGKTMQTLAFVAAIKKHYPQKINTPVLIVAPVALLRNWKEEIYKFLPRGIFTDVIELHSTGMQKFKQNGVLNLANFAEEYKDCIVQTTYETLRREQLRLGEIPWSIIVVDEAQKIKNPSTRQTQALKAMKYDFTICLSGTPVENSWIDLWSIMDFVEPGKLGSFASFNDNYQKKLKANKRDLEVIKQLGTKLQNQLDPLFLRRLKKEHLKGLPQKHVELCKSVMPKLQLETYKNVIQCYREEQGTPLAVIAKLRDVSLHPRLAVMQPQKMSAAAANSIINESARLKKTFEILINVKMKNEKALIFVVSKKMQLLLQYLIQGFLGVEVQTPINGDMNGMVRQNIIDDFNAKEGFGVLILSPEAAGVGLNIVSANHVIHLSRTWNPAKEDQATDRVYRIGQKKDVTVYIPIAYSPELGEGNAFDEKLEALMTFKRNISENVLFPTEQSDDDIETIFGGITGVKGEGENVLVWTIEDVDALTGIAFEELVKKLYCKMGYDTLKTPQSNDKGADVIAWTDRERRNGWLIQCKQTTTQNNLNADGVQEVYSAKAFYEQRYKCSFKTLVITNAGDFTSNAKTLAKQNGVELIGRKQLSDLLAKYKVLKA